MDFEGESETQTVFVFVAFLCFFFLSPFFVQNHLIRASWSPDGSRVCAGSADRCVYVWDTTTKQILYKLPGHKGVVNSVVFHPDPAQPIILSASADKTLYLGELAAGVD